MGCMAYTAGTTDMSRHSSPAGNLATRFQTEHTSQIDAANIPAVTTVVATDDAQRVDT